MIENNPPPDAVYINRAFSASYGAKPLSGSSYARIRVAEQIRRDFLGQCQDKAVARQLATLLTRPHIWINAGRLGLKAFEIKASEILADVPRMDALLQLANVAPRTNSSDEIEAMKAEADTILIRYLDLISGRIL